MESQLSPIICKIITNVFMYLSPHKYCRPLGITFPSGAVQRRLLEDVYGECSIDPTRVSYVEAHGTGTKAGDPQEVNTIVEVFCGKGREKPLLIGSTKSNMGHPEPASGERYFAERQFDVVKTLKFEK